MENKEYLSQIAAQEKQYDALYRAVGSKFGISDCTMWTLYYLLTSEEQLTQQDLIEKMMFPKQTINSAVMNLAKSGSVELQIVPGTRNRKTILLTDTGRKLANDTVKHMYAAELCAVKAMGPEKMEQFIKLYSEFFDCLRTAFQAEGVIDGSSSSNLQES